MPLPEIIATRYAVGAAFLLLTLYGNAKEFTSFQLLERNVTASPSTAAATLTPPQVPSSTGRVVIALDVNRIFGHDP